MTLADLRAGGPALIVFASEECPTCGLALRRLTPVVERLARAGVPAAVVFEDPLEVAARVARRAGFPGTVLSEPSPYEVSAAYELQSLPTTILVDRAGADRRPRGGLGRRGAGRAAGPGRAGRWRAARCR